MTSKSNAVIIPKIKFEGTLIYKKNIKNIVILMIVIKIAIQKIH